MARSNIRAMGLFVQFMKQVVGMADKEERHLAMCDERGVLFTNDSYRYFCAITTGTPLPHGPCDALIATAAGGATVVGGDNTVGEAIAIELIQGINKVSVSEVTATTLTLVAAYHRRPAGA